MSQRGAAASARPSTGRARNEQSRRAILDAALQLAQHDLGMLTVDQIAARAGVGKQTIYRWWPSKWAVVLDALLDRAEREVVAESGGPLQVDLAGFLTSTFLAITRDGGAGPLLKALMAQAQLDAAFAALWRERFLLPRRQALVRLLRAAAQRGETPPDLDADVTADLLFGGLWYRLLAGHAPLDGAYARQLAYIVSGSGR